ncbi:hypothetical protein [Flavimaricola marinus]|uniref:hypothetical protein n=1 Tax=Flavimaricola marinus TaxID=1819565 RepID=UPI000B8B66E7|nr:hypothetical protein [Flavimaricola marinus]
MLHDQPDALQPERRQILEVWLQNPLEGWDEVEAGCTLGDALVDLEGIVADETNASALQDIRHWLERIGAG